MTWTFSPVEGPASVSVRLPLPAQPQGFTPRVGQNSMGADSAMMLEQNDEWSLNRRYMQLEGLQTLSDTVPTRLSAVAR